MLSEARPERRRTDHARAPFRVTASVSLAGSAGAAPVALTENLSGGGLRLRLFERSSPGTEVAVSLHLFDRPALKRAGRIAWVKRDTVPPGAWLVGIEFHEELAPALLNQIVAEGHPA